MVISLTLPDGEVAAILPVAAIDRRRLFIYLEAIDSRFRETIASSPDLSPMFVWRETKDGIGKTLCKIFEMSGVSIEGDCDATTLAGILEAIARANQIDERPPRKQNEDDGGIVIESSGNIEADVVADLAKMFGMDGAIAAYRTFDINFIYYLCDRYAKASEDPEKLKERSAQKRAVEKFKKAIDRMEELGIDSFEELTPIGIDDVL